MPRDLPLAQTGEDCGQLGRAIRVTFDDIFIAVPGRPKAREAAGGGSVAAAWERTHL